MGKRRVRNLLKHGESDVMGFDVREDRAKEARRLYGIPTGTNFKKALQSKPDAFIISCPPDKHLPYAHHALDRDMPFFSEVNTAGVEKMRAMARKAQKASALAAPSCTMRCHPCVLAIKKLVQSKTLGRPMLLTYHSGANLEDWHPWEKVTDYYVGKKETGGGRDQTAFELEWIRWLLGNVKSVRALTTKLSKVAADIYDVYDLLLEFESGAVSNVLVDLIQRPANRIFRLVCEKGVIHWDWMTHTVRAFHTKDGKWEEIAEGPGFKGYLTEEMYEDEMKMFLDALNGNSRYPLTFQDELEIIEVVYASEKSSETGRKIVFGR
jgi:predicted dehydrogenase